MAVFRVEKNKGYTVMSNHHLRNKELSLKAKGWLSQMLSLPKIGTTPLQGCPLSTGKIIDAIRTAVWELEKAGYITRQRDANRERQNDRYRVHHLRTATAPGIGLSGIGKSNSG